MRTADDENTTLVVTIGVLTYRRPADLVAILPVLVEQAQASDDDVHVLVIDNAPEASAEETTRTFPPRFVHYIHEPTPGIAAARNRAIDESTSSDLLIFIDDDERPVGEWLAALLSTYRAERPAGIAGPVISHYEEEPDPWIVGGGFFARERFATGTEVEVAATNNLLLDLAVVRRLGLRFDEEFGLSGGSDTLFTRSLTVAGERIVWCDDAVVLDIVPASRLTRRWVLQRYYRMGNTWSRTTLLLSRSTPSRLLARLSLTAGGAARVAQGAARSGWGRLARSTSRDAHGQRTLNRGLGMVAGAWGHVYSEYRRA
ncbi:MULTISPECIES: glycosyltransferase family 2 protein [unclassified Leifsonia]|uniref:glycosyltransferase family 2 protein n=1 Tax=unclassified Leifsonia TaxID=2663824 RepID=UPI0006F64221|nr:MULTISPECIES: glycosyltransferase [unclassified Leifsonia]KQX08047.1 glycosyl transferase family 2 [Leifsonia sp. Root1293]KRA12328.1 glycosyl transferase family 2 [Leifsonia sp. Root60]